MSLGLSLGNGSVVTIQVQYAGVRGFSFGCFFLRADTGGVRIWLAAEHRAMATSFNVPT